jgi:pilus assembly protein CpaB
MRMILVILAALIVAGGAGFYVMQGLRSPGQTAAVAVAVEAPRLAEVYTPAQDIPAGMILTADRLSRLAMDPQAVSAQMVVADREGETFLVGSVARQNLPQGMPIARSATVQPGDRGFLAAVLPKGKRAITIPVSETAGLNGLAIPGDWVDLILTYTVVGDDDDGGDSTGSKPRDIHASETVARNIRLLALDNRVNAQHQDDKGKLILPPAPTSATLQVTPRQAEQIALATTLGSLSLTLNSVRDGGEKVDEMSADGVRPSPVEPVGLTKPALSRTAAAQGLDMTLDSDVTSLLRLEVQKAVPEQVSRIQVVRGRGNALAETRPLKSGADALAGAPEPADPEGE